jgi:molybdopterin converting factor small subunit
MPIRIELYGIARRRAGVEQATFEATAEGARLGDLLRELQARYPALAPECLADGRLQRGFVANRNGEQFLSDPNAMLDDGDVLLILSADAGG